MVLAHYTGGQGGCHFAQGERMEGAVSRVPDVSGNTPPIANHRCVLVAEPNRTIPSPRLAGRGWSRLRGTGRGVLICATSPRPSPPTSLAGREEIDAYADVSIVHG